MAGRKIQRTYQKCNCKMFCRVEVTVQWKNQVPHQSVIKGMAHCPLFWGVTPKSMMISHGIWPLTSRHHGHTTSNRFIVQKSVGKYSNFEAQI